MFLNFATVMKAGEVGEKCRATMAQSRATSPQSRATSPRTQMKGSILK